MKFCQYCGKQLADNEVCTCQQNAAQGQQSGNQPQQSAGVYGQQPQGQPQQSTGAYGQQWNNQSQQIDAAAYKFNEEEAAGEIVKLVKGIISTPVTAISEFVKKANAMTCVILIAVYAFIELVLVGINIADESITYASSLYEHHIEFKSVISSAFTGIVGCVGGILITAVVIMAIINAFQKNKKITYTQALSVACLFELVYLPAAVVANIIGLVPLSFFSYLNSWVLKFAAVAGYIYTFFGIREIEEDDNKMPVVYATAATAAAVCTTIVNLIF